MMARKTYTLKKGPAAGMQVTVPDYETLREWMEEESGCEALDGCWVEPDGKCEHGYVSWLRSLGMI